MKKYGMLSLTLLFLSSGVLQAQKEINVGTNLLADNNILRNYKSQGDVVTIPYADLGYQFNSDPASETVDALFLGYSGQFYLFRKLSYRDFSVHRFGADYNHLRPGSRNLIALGGRLETRLNPEDYKYYNYTSGGLYLNLKRYLRENLMLLAGYNLTGKKFSEFPEFNYLENIFSLQASLFLESRTTLRFITSYYHKNYTNSVSSLDSVFIQPPEYLGGITRRDMGFGFRPPFGMSSWGMTSGPEEGEGFFSYRWREDEFPSTDQVKLGFSVAQNLAEGTGLMASYTARINPRNRNRYLANLGESVLNNEELFDDHYSYTGHEGRLQIKQLLPGDSRLTLLLTARKRDFNERPAMDLEGYYLPGGEDRRDKAVLFETEFTKRLGTGLSQMTNDLELSVGFGVAKNSSNDEYYDFSDAYFIFSVEKAF